MKRGVLAARHGDPDQGDVAALTGLWQSLSAKIGFLPCRRLESLEEGMPFGQVCVWQSADVAADRSVLDLMPPVTGAVPAFYDTTPIKGRLGVLQHAGDRAIPTPGDANGRRSQHRKVKGCSTVSIRHHPEPCPASCSLRRPSRLPS